MVDLLSTIKQTNQNPRISWHDDVYKSEALPTKRNNINILYDIIKYEECNNFNQLNNDPPDLIVGLDAINSQFNQYSNDQIVKKFIIISNCMDDADNKI